MVINTECLYKRAGPPKEQAGIALLGVWWIWRKGDLRGPFWHIPRDFRGI